MGWLAKCPTGLAVLIRSFVIKVCRLGMLLIIQLLVIDDPIALVVFTFGATDTNGTKLELLDDTMLLVPLDTIMPVVCGGLGFVLIKIDRSSDVPELVMTLGSVS
jgi:hypothetical protein